MIKQVEATTMCTCGHMRRFHYGYDRIAERWCDAPDCECAQFEAGEPAPIDTMTAVKCISRMRTVLTEIEEYVSNYVDIDWEGRPNWAMAIKVMLEKCPEIKR